MLAQDVRMWALNIYYLIGLLIFVSLSLAAMVVIYTGLRMYLFARRQRRSLQEYHQRTRRADGRMYPPFTGGICDICGGIRRKIYHLHSGERLCPECYEPFWRAAERWTSCGVGNSKPAQDAGSDHRAEK